MLHQGSELRFSELDTQSEGSMVNTISDVVRASSIVCSLCVGVS